MSIFSGAGKWLCKKWLPHVRTALRVLADVKISDYSSIAIVTSHPSDTTRNHAAFETGLTFTQPSLLLAPPSTLLGISSFLLAWSHHHEHFLSRRQMVEQKMAA
jgi:hypothetical protein